MPRVRLDVHMKDTISWEEARNSNKRVTRTKKGSRLSSPEPPPHSLTLLALTTTQPFPVVPQANFERRICSQAEARCFCESARVVVHLNLHHSNYEWKGKRTLLPLFTQRNPSEEQGNVQYSQHQNHLPHKLALLCSHNTTTVPSHFSSHF